MVVRGAFLGSVFLVLIHGMIGCADPTLLGQTDRGIIGGEITKEWDAVGGFLPGWEPGMGFDKSCTASLIAPDVVLTAAHCTEETNGSDWFFLGNNYGAIDWTSLYRVEETIPHPDYEEDGDTNDYDVAVLVLEEPFTDIACLGLNTEPVTDAWIGDTLHYVGFGITTTYGDWGPGAGGGEKRETDVEIDSYDDLWIYRYTEGTSTCSGDSGGPALLETESGWDIAGVVSYAYRIEPDAEICTGGADVRVDAVLDFIGEYVDLGEPPCEPEEIAADDDTEDVEDEGGCECSAASRAHPGGAFVLLGVALLGARRVRR